MNYTLLLLELTALTAVVWLADRLFLRRRRQRREGAESAPREPWAVEWSRALFPMLLLVLIVRSAVAEPFHIPSGSMMPTLDVGDFIFVSKFSYGIGLPPFEHKLVETGEPRRGDVVVFRPPWAPGENWIKRVVGLPGDRVVVRGENVWINGKAVTAEPVGAYRGNPGKNEDASLIRNGAQVLEEDLDGVQHRIIEMPAVNASPLGAPDVPNQDNPAVVPAGCYFVMGDNRDNSEDSRYHGCVPARDLVGRAFVIWLSLASLRRIGTLIH